MMRMPSEVFTVTAALLLASTSARVSANDLDQQVPTDPHGTVEVSTFSGSVDVTGWDQPQVSVHSSGSNDATHVEVRSEHGRVAVTVRMHGFHRGGDVDLRIKIPRSNELDVTTVSADVTSSGVLGTQRLKTVSGRIKADFVQADIEAKTVSGDVDLMGQGKPVGLHASSISGSVRVEHGAGDAEATTVSGDLDMHLDPGRSVRTRNTSGRTVIRGSLAKDADIDAQSVSGDIRLHASPRGGYEYEVSTFSGSIRNCFNAQAEHTSQYGPGERLNGSRGNASGHVRMKTMSGELDLCDKP
jgi:DUF4097 and DUF4098 domain-containing protein YvlB